MGIHVSYLPGKKDKPAGSTPEQIVLHSSFLSAATYDPASFSLTLEFKTGEPIIYRYVFPAVWSEFKLHPSPGKYWNENIKGGKYPSFSLKPGLKVSDITRAKKKYKHGVKF